MKEICLTQPENIEKIISANHKKERVMGNGYSIKSGSNGIGYLSIFYDFVFLNDSLISYKLNLPFKDILLLEKNQLKPQKIFIKTEGVFSNSNDYLFFYGFEDVCKPIGIKQKEDISNKMQFYMSPFSGIDYGCRGGYGNSLLPNRCAFKQLANNQINFKDLIYIMSSINIASRLTAIEYYTINIKMFNYIEQNEIEELISKIFLEFGDKKIRTLSDDIGYYLTIEDAINKQLENNCN